MFPQILMNDLIPAKLKELQELNFSILLKNMI